jgi:Flp pilus assembly protein TadD
VSVAALVLAGAAVYANALHGPFTFDDEAAITGNASIRSLGAALTPPDRGEPVAGRPIANLSFALNYAIGGLDVRGYHAFNIALHIACAIALFALARRHLPDGAAFAASLLWLVHPLTTEAVNYVSQRTETLMALFYLLTLLAAARDRVGLAVATCAAGMACKETMATAPLVVLLYDRTFRFGSFVAAWRARWRFYAALASTWGLLAALIWSGPRWETAGFATGVSPWTYLLNQAVMIVEYLRRVVWPRGLVLDYGEPVAYMLSDVLWQGAIVMALLAATGWALVRRPAAGFVAACAFIILAPTSSIIPIATEVGAERRMYLPLAAIVVLVVAAAQHLPVRPVMAAVVALLLAAGTVARNAEYRDALTLWESTLARWPTPRAHRNVATELKRAGRAAEALVHVRLSLSPEHPEARYALGYELFEQGHHAEAASELARFIGEVPQDPNVGSAHALIAAALLKEQRLAEAAPHLREAARRRPDMAERWITLGVTLAEMREFPEAEAALRKGVASAPRDSTARMMLGLVLAAQGRLPDAAAELRVSIALNPSNAEAREHLTRIEALLRGAS